MSNSFKIITKVHSVCCYSLKSIRSVKYCCSNLFLADAWLTLVDLKWQIKMVGCTQICMVTLVYLQ